MKSWSSVSRNLVELVATLGEQADVMKIELLHWSHRYGLPRFDQTLTPVGEAGIEFVIRKRPSDEVEHGGRKPLPGKMPNNAFALLTGIQPPTAD